MRKTYLFLAICLVALTSLTSCGDKESEGLTHITHYPDLQLEGATVMNLQQGDAFVEPGYTATMDDGSDVTSRVVVTTDLDSNTPGVYTVNYTFVNDDNYARSAVRNVCVVTAGDPYEGYYIVSDDTYRDSGGSLSPYSGYMIYVHNNGDGTYSIDDMLGGYYAQYRGNGSAYAAEGIVTIDGSGNITLENSSVAGWGDSLSSLSDGVADSTEGVISFVSEYAGMKFYVTLTKASKE